MDVEKTNATNYDYANLQALRKRSFEIKFDLEGTDYEPIENIGSGAYGVVCSAINRKTKKKVAIKKIPNIFDQNTVAKRTYREIKILKHFKHDNIISICKMLKPKEELKDVFIVLDLMESDLHRIIHSKQDLTAEHVRYFLYQILRGLKYIHSANVIHRDLKPSNLLVNENCDLKIGDFGMARGFSSEHNEARVFMTQYVATRWYRAPELILCRLDYSGAVDVWSVGCIFAEMLGRKQLFPGKSSFNQLELIRGILGRPPPEIMESKESEITRNILTGMNQVPHPPVSFKKLYPDAESKALDLLSRMLVYSPNERIAVESGLSHPYLSKYHDPDDEPVCIPVFDFNFEKDLKDEDLKPLIMKEIMDYHKPRQPILGKFNLKPVSKDQLNKKVLPVQNIDTAKKQSALPAGGLQAFLAQHPRKKTPTMPTELVCRSAIGLHPDKEPDLKPAVTGLGAFLSHNQEKQKENIGGLQTFLQQNQDNKSKQMGLQGFLDKEQENELGKKDNGKIGTKSGLGSFLQSKEDIKSKPKITDGTGLQAMLNVNAGLQAFLKNKQEIQSSTKDLEVFSKQEKPSGKINHIAPARERHPHHISVHENTTSVPQKSAALREFLKQQHRELEDHLQRASSTRQELPDDTSFRKPTVKTKGISEVTIDLTVPTTASSDVEMLSARSAQGDTQGSLTVSVSSGITNADIEMLSAKSNESSKPNQVQPAERAEAAKEQAPVMDAKARIKEAILNARKQKLAEGGGPEKPRRITAQQRQKEREDRRKQKLAKAKERRKKDTKGKTEDENILTEADRNLLERWKTLQQQTKPFIHPIRKLVESNTSESSTVVAAAASNEQQLLEKVQDASPQSKKYVPLQNMQNLQSSVPSQTESQHMVLSAQMPHQIAQPSIQTHIMSQQLISTPQQLPVALKPAMEFTHQSQAVPGYPSNLLVDYQLQQNSVITQSSSINVPNVIPQNQLIMQLNLTELLRQQLAQRTNSGHGTQNINNPVEKPALNNTQIELTQPGSVIIEHSLNQNLLSTVTDDNVYRNTQHDNQQTSLFIPQSQDDSQDSPSDYTCQRQDSTASQGNAEFMPPLFVSQTSTDSMGFPSPSRDVLWSSSFVQSSEHSNIDPKQFSLDYEAKDTTMPSHNLGLSTDAHASTSMHAGITGTGQVQQLSQQPFPPSVTLPSKTMTSAILVPNVTMADAFDKSHKTREKPDLSISTSGETSMSTMSTPQSSIPPLPADWLKLLANKLSKHHVEDLTLTQTPKGTGEGYGVGVDLDAILRESGMRSADDRETGGTCPDSAPLSATLIADWKEFFSNIDLEMLQQELQMDVLPTAQ